MNLLDMLKAEIDKAEFNMFEVAGFKAKPDLALLAGAIIGYRLAMQVALKSTPPGWTKKMVDNVRRV